MSNRSSSPSLGITFRWVKKGSSVCTVFERTCRSFQLLLVTVRIKLALLAAAGHQADLFTPSTKAAEFEASSLAVAFAKFPAVFQPASELWNASF